MKKIFFALSIMLVSFTSFTHKEETPNFNCTITMIQITRYNCGDVYEGSSSVVNTAPGCTSQTYYDIETGPDVTLCTHDHSAPPDGVN
jgi:hypothetical protein